MARVTTVFSASPNGASDDGRLGDLRFLNVHQTFFRIRRRREVCKEQSAAASRRMCVPCGVASIGASFSQESFVCLEAK